RTLILRGDRWWIDLPASETKTKQPIEMPWPEILAGQLETYLARHRPVLAAFRRRGAPAAGDAPWVSKAGSPMDRRTIYQTIVDRTREGLGRPINPHLFRDCAVTSIAVDAPRDIDIAAPLLGHESPLTTEKYYNQARSIEAVRRLQTVL